MEDMLKTDLSGKTKFPKQSNALHWTFMLVVKWIMWQKLPAN